MLTSLILAVVLVNYCKYQRNIHSMGDEFGKEVSSVKHTTDKNRKKQTKTHKKTKKTKQTKKTVRQTDKKACKKQNNIQTDKKTKQ